VHALPRTMDARASVARWRALRCTADHGPFAWP
jgi:hypothetical protein